MVRCGGSKGDGDQEHGPLADQDMDRSMPGTDRRNSSSSEDANSLPPSRQMSQDGSEVIPTRANKVAAAKPASNPLQFIKVGPCDLYKAAQEQIKKVEEIKKVEKVKDHSEDWQSNLDNWKCSRRKRQEHIIERVVEVKKLELEEHDRNRKRSKTFNEMMEERTKGGGVRKMSLLTYPDEDSNDLSDLGITATNKDDETLNGLDNGQYHEGNGNQKNGVNGSNGHRNEYESSTSTTTSSPEPEEYTYERAIQGYMNFAETKMKTPIKNVNEGKGVNGTARGSPPRKETGSKVGARLSELEQLRRRSESAIEVGVKHLPRVDIHKRRSMFENSESLDASPKSVDRVAKDLTNSKSIKERLSHLGKTNDVSKSSENLRASNGDVSHVSIKERLCSLEQQADPEAKAGARSPAADLATTVTIKERVSHLDSAKQKDTTTKLSPERDSAFREKLETFKSTERSQLEIVNKEESERKGMHRSLEDLDASGKGSRQSSFERVQSMEELETAGSAEPAVFISESSLQIEAVGEHKPVVSGEGGTECTLVEEGVVVEGAEVAEVAAQETQDPNTVTKSSETTQTAETSETETEDAKQEEEDEEGDDEQEEGEEEGIASLPSNFQNYKAWSDRMVMRKPQTRVRKLTPILTPPPQPLVTGAACELQIIEEGDLAAAEEAERASPGRGGSRQDMEMEKEDADQEEESLYTDENIDEVLAKDDVEEVESPIDDEMVTRFDGSVEETPAAEAPDSAPAPPAPSYENIVITNQLPHINMAGDVEMVANLSFPLGSAPVEPPKEKPPPPPLELSDDEATPELPPKPSVRRLDSTKRIKKEIRKKRSDFLGIDGPSDDSYLEPEVYMSPPPDMMTFLQEERRLEQQLYRQSICSESDSNHETAESRDSGVELDRGHDMCWSKQPLSPDVLSEPHSRQNSETFGNTSITSEEDEIMKKEREIIEVLEKEEQWRYGSNTNSTEENAIGEKLAVKLRQLEQEKMQLEWQRAEEEGRRQVEEAARREEEERLKAKEQQLKEQENNSSNPNKDSSLSQEALRSERERLAKEQQELERCRLSLAKHQAHGSADSLELRPKGLSPWDTPSSRHSLQDVPRLSMQDVSHQPMCSSYRFSMPDLQQRPPAPVPPTPPAKPVRPHAAQQTTQMTRSTLHALSAAPRSRIITNENWMQPKRKTDVPKSNYNYQHWLIQEAEHRRIIEQQHRAASHGQQARRSLPPPSHYHTPPGLATSPSHHTVGLPVTPQGHKWVSPPRTDKPLPDSVIQTLTQRVHNRASAVEAAKSQPRRRLELAHTENKPPAVLPTTNGHDSSPHQLPRGGEAGGERMLSVSGKKKCSHCDEELGRGAAMIIESLRLFYHIDCFKCCVCHVQLGDGLIGTDVRVRNNKLHCHNCYSSDDELEECFNAECWEMDFDESAEESDEVDDLGQLDLVEGMPSWFRVFYGQYRNNENRKLIMMQKMHLDMIDYEIRKCELLKDIINKLK